MQGNIVLVGVGGAGVSALAGLFHELGYRNIVGIDSAESELTHQLQAQGINVTIGHGTYKVQPDDKVIYSAATQQSPEVIYAKEHLFDNHKRIFPPMLYAQFLGEISKYMCTIAITGTHGKSTTTALTATALHAHHENFGLGIVGATIPQRNQNNYITKPSTVSATKAILDHIFDPKALGIEDLMKQYLFVVEADEYNRHFLHLDPDYAIITNIELDHADIYGDETTYIETFQQFARKVRHTIWMLEDAKGGQAMRESASLMFIPQHHFPFTHLLGSHNHGNASLALACAEALVVGDLPTGTSPNDLNKQLHTTITNFQGLRRRGELIGTNIHGTTIISDYGHHPTELASTLLAIREKFPDKKISCIFQPHQARRVMEFRDEFVATLQTVDQLIIYDIYAARERLDELKQRFTQFGHIETIDQLGELFAKTAGGRYTTDFTGIASLLTDTHSDNLIVIFTAGDLDFQVRNFLQQEKSNR